MIETRVRVCARVCVLACGCGWVRVRARVRACVRACVCGWVSPRQVYPAPQVLLCSSLRSFGLGALCLSKDRAGQVGRCQEWDRPYDFIAPSHPTRR